MKLKFVTTKLANHFFYISILTNWNNALFRKETQNEWNDMLGPLNKVEKTAIDNVAKILIKYQKNREKWLQNIFYFFEDEISIWKWIRNNYTASEHNDLKKAFEVTQAKFNKLWQKVDEEKLNKFLKQLEKYCSQSLFDRMKTYFKFKEWDNACFYVAVCPIVIGKGVAGHAWGDENLIINIEISDLDIKIDNIRETALLISHEIFHSIFAKTKCLQIFKEEITLNKIDKIMPNSLVLFNFYNRPFVLVEESMVATFCNFYYLRIKWGQARELMEEISSLFDKNGKLIIQKKLEKRKILSRREVLLYIGYKMFPQVWSYISRNKPIDRKLIRLFARQVKELLDWEDGHGEIQ